MHYLDTNEAKAQASMPPAYLQQQNMPQRPLNENFQNAPQPVALSLVPSASVTRQWDPQEIVNILDTAPEFVLTGDSCKIIMVLAQPVNDRGPLYCSFGEQKVGLVVIE